MKSFKVKSFYKTITKNVKQLKFYDYEKII